MYWSDAPRSFGYGSAPTDRTTKLPNINHIRMVKSKSFSNKQLFPEKRHGKLPFYIKFLIYPKGACRHTGVYNATLVVCG